MAVGILTIGETLSVELVTACGGTAAIWTPVGGGAVVLAKANGGVAAIGTLIEREPDPVWLRGDRLSPLKGQPVTRWIV